MMMSIQNLEQTKFWVLISLFWKITSNILLYIRNMGLKNIKRNNARAD